MSFIAHGVSEGLLLGFSLTLTLLTYADEKHQFTVQFTVHLHTKP